jgi:hypothetical protein
MEQGRPGKGRPFTARVLLLQSYSYSVLFLLSLVAYSLVPSVLLLANFLTGALASERGFYAFLLTGLQVKGVALDLFNNVFLLHLALEAAQGVLEGFTLLQSNFRQTDTPPNPSGRTD